MTDPPPKRFWKVAVDYHTSRYIARTSTADPVYAVEVVPEPVPFEEVAVDGFEVVGPASRGDFDDWEASRERGTATGAPNDEEPEDEEAYEEFGEWGGIVWVARGKMTVVVAADDPDALDYGDLEACLPTVLTPDDFRGAADIAPWL